MATVFNPLTPPFDEVGLTNPINYLKFNLTPVVTLEEGTVYWSDDDKTLVIVMEGGNTHEIGQNLELRATNKTGSDILNGSVVYISGAQGNKPTIALADADVEASADAVIGMTTEDINNNNSGRVTVFGVVKGLDTSTLATTDTLYLSQTAGQFTKVKPTQPAHIVKIGHPVKIDATDGWILLDINHGEHLSNLHDVLLTSPVANSALVYNGSLWVNQLLTSLGVVFKDTQANIEALTPADGRIAFATDKFCFMYANGTEWKRGSEIFTSSPNRPDIGASRSEAPSGYGYLYVDGKIFTNGVIGGNVDMTREGAIRTLNGVASMTLGGTIKDLVTGLRLREDSNEDYQLEINPIGLTEWYSVMNGNSDAKGINGIPISQEFRADIGADGALLVIDGGYF